ncbi:uncharacterized protein LOC113310754 isoform X1 [Papaver somniferum]|uniref:uncharacterized protein LOC113310754 isoform X1 n=1 Tax=Papaver somniferum TaxID=3469 RepID=UPI000E6F4876|nr:uncharacterized protein LOC113310754 isoform X1 [Papaver somniferum]XP_026415306.1 uncharacterized protein LOC113310754 isoform X1 [Papaver somniferum]XP_026415307.1 uncharacterized protein LOC113310754 isoform X1 [Papaver somniferum]XP_026415309.1 uncharacterized protein LOC113310754 isoform X1 [Papaver somniferum]XP_026415310.1 uncharacterized protein LOC113310754 isoform X1 [Papaver somniferum]
MEEKWRHDEAQPTSARTERFAARLKRRRIEHKRSPSENKHDYPIHNSIIILDSDVDETEHPEVVGAVSEKDPEVSSGENGKTISERDVDAAPEKEVATAPGEDVVAACKEDAEAAFKREVEAASGEDVVAPCDEGAEAASSGGSDEGTVDLASN